MDGPFAVHRTRNRIIQIRLNDEEKEAVELAAEATGLSMSNWIRLRLREATIESLRAAGRPVPFLEGR